MPNHFHAMITNVGADLRVCPENNSSKHPERCDKDHFEETQKWQTFFDKEGEHTGSPLPYLCELSDLCGKMYELIGLKSIFID